MTSPPQQPWWVIYREPSPAEIEVVAVELPPGDDTAHDKRCAELQEAQQHAYIITAPDADTAGDIALRVWAEELVASPARLAAADAQLPHPLDPLEKDMLTIASEILCASLVSRLGVHPAAARSALLATVEHFHAQSHNPAVLRAGLTPAEYMDTAVQTPRFAATLSSSALLADGREADARLNWEAYVQREISAAKRAHRAVPPTVLLGDPDAIHRIGRRLGLIDEQTDQFVPGIVLTLATGYPYRAHHQRHLSLTDILAQVTTEDMTELLRHTALSAAGHTEEAAATLRRMHRAAR
ncbi:hypothetical protein FBY35_5882 [Streptomyces sp. SLBN-118]|uniref:hypothetical protein n=1 Tax=Streptomyces sp. SLBN-118 TaxID=2768454 RepID=UPI0011503BFB|nr:hypothetical protein [Streptomyces sp. SLBN-118]TQK44378.1 hypothetical protein FBY35_5882 [Streptomyces sp. SLBN-118]